MVTIKSILERGFGIISINEALSIKYCNGLLELCITPLPGYNTEPVFIPLAERVPDKIIEEISCNVRVFFRDYRYAMLHDIDMYSKGVPSWMV